MNKQNSFLFAMLVLAGGFGVAEGSPPSQADAERFLEQSTFGPTPALTAHVQAVGFAAYLQEQFAAAASTYPSLPEQPQSAKAGCPAGSPATCLRDNYSMYPLQVQFFRNALSAEDQLRQRVALALHEILVVSGVKIRQPSEVSPYLNMLLEDAFGNYRQILYDLTLNPAMGHYLDMVNNDAPAAGRLALAERELRARSPPALLDRREPAQSRRHGRSRRDRQPGSHVHAGHHRGLRARLHRMDLRSARRRPPRQARPAELPRAHGPLPERRGEGRQPRQGRQGPFSSTRGASIRTCRPTRTASTDLAEALDNIFHHPNVGPFIGKQLIQHLVTSNPSPAYVSRVAAAFADDGTGVRGDMKAVVRAILMDPEARGSAKTDPGYGHLREPVLFITGLLRAFDGATNGEMAGQANAMGQDLFNSPSVFSYYPHQYFVPGTSIQGPEFGIESTATAIARANFVNAVAFEKGILSGTSIDVTDLASLAGDPAALVERLNQNLLHGTMSGPMRETIENAVSAVRVSDAELRARTALYLVATSSQYQVER